MRRIPFLLGLFFIIVTLTRVADFAGAGTGDLHVSVLAWATALGLTVSVFISAYFTDFARPRTTALWCLAFFLLVDGLFNTLETLRWSVETKQWDFFLYLGTLPFTEIPISVPIYRFGHLIYGIFPTASAALMGVLARKVETVGTNRKAGFFGILRQEFLDWLIGRSETETEPKPKPKPKTAAQPKAEPKSEKTPKLKSKPETNAEIIFAYLKKQAAPTEVPLAELQAVAGCAPSTASYWKNKFMEDRNGHSTRNA